MIWREGVVAQDVDAAVADVRDAGSSVPDEERGGGRRHPAQILRVGDGRGDPAVGEPERRLQAVGFEAERRIERERPGAVLVGAGGLLDEGLDRFDRDARRDLAGDVTAHAVGDDEEADVRTSAMTVFVAGAPEAGVGADGPAERQRRRRRHGYSISLVCASASLRPSRDAADS